MCAKHNTANMYMKKVLKPSLVIRDIQIKAIVRYYYVHEFRMAKTKAKLKTDTLREFTAVHWLRLHMPRGQKESDPCLL